MSEKRRWIVPLLYFLSYFFILNTLGVLGLSVDMADSFELIGMVSVLVVFWYLSKYYNIPLLDLSSLTWQKALMGLGIGFVGSYISGIIINMLPSETLANQTAVEEMVGQSNIVLMFLTIVIFAPIVEEILFRRIIIGYGFEKYPWIGLVVSSAIFSLLHLGFSVTAFTTYFLLGFVIGLVYLQTKSIEAAILWHMINNLIAFSVLVS